METDLLKERMLGTNSEETPNATKALSETIFQNGADTLKSEPFTRETTPGSDIVDGVPSNDGTCSINSLQSSIKFNHDSHEASPTNFNGVNTTVEDGGSSSIARGGGGGDVAAKNDKKRKKKDDKSQESILKSLSNLSTPEDKLIELCKRYADMAEDHRVSVEKCKHAQRQSEQLQVKRDQLQSEHSKVVLAKDRLENLCRELQKQNKQIKEDAIARTKDDEERRKEISQKFQATITEIKAQMGEYHSMNAKLRSDNQQLSDKVQQLVEHYDKREQHMEKMVQMKELQSQLSEAKLHQSSCQMEAERSHHEQEKIKLHQQIDLLNQKCKVMTEHEMKLKEQIEFYQTKYEEFHQNLSKSSEVFTTCKSEMNKMTKKLKTLEKECLSWKQKYENSNRSALHLAAEKAEYEEKIQFQTSKISKLESLCRALQQLKSPLLNDHATGGIEKLTGFGISDSTAKVKDVSVDLEHQSSKCDCREALASTSSHSQSCCTSATTDVEARCDHLVDDEIIKSPKPDDNDEIIAMEQQKSAENNETTQNMKRSCEGDTINEESINGKAAASITSAAACDNQEDKSENNSNTS